MNKSRKIVADLHAHSRASDGDLEPGNVVREAHHLGLQAVALTDHETIAGLREALRIGEELGVTVICGVEVSIRFRRADFTGSLHYLLYFSQSLLKSADFVTTLSGILSSGRGDQLNADRVTEINALFGPRGVLEPVLKRPLTVEEIQAEASNVTRRHFANVLIRRHGLDQSQVNRLISNGSPAYVPSGIEMERLRPLFERFPMIRVLAHPAAGSFPEPSIYNEVLPPVETVEQILPEFLSLGLDGLEVYYPGHAPQHIRQLLGWADKYRLLVTGGSDFHDCVMRPLGVAGLEKNELDVLLDRLHLMIHDAQPS